MKRFGYALTGAFVGLILGMFLGSIFGIAYVKKSQRDAVSAVQAVIGGIIGTTIGLNIGIKIADEEEEEELARQRYEKEKEQAQQRYKESLVTKVCKICGKNFTYSTLEESYDDDICKSCSSEIEFATSSLFHLVYKCRNEIQNLKRIHAKLSRYENMINETKKLLDFEKKGAHIQNITPSKFLEDLYTQKDNLIINEIQSKMNLIFEKANSHISNKRKATLLMNFLEKLYEYKKNLTYDKDINDLIDFINNMIKNINRSDGKEKIVIPAYRILK